MFRLFLLLCSFCAVARADEATTQYGDEIFKLISPTTVVQLMAKLMMFPLRIVGHAILPFLETPYHVGQRVWSWAVPGTKLPGMSPDGARMLSSGILAGIASRILEVDLVDTVMNAMKVDKRCTRKAACEMGAYVLHTNSLLAPIMTNMFISLFNNTSKHWGAMKRGMEGAVCHEVFASCEKEFLMRR